MIVKRVVAVIVLVLLVGTVLNVAFDGYLLVTYALMVATVLLLPHGRFREWPTPTVIELPDDWKSVMRREVSCCGDAEEAIDLIESWQTRR